MFSLYLAKTSDLNPNLMIIYNNDENDIVIKITIIGKPNVINHKGKIVGCNVISWNINIRNKRM